MARPQVQNATEMFWFSVSSVVPAKLKTEQKRQQMTAARVAQYNQEIVRSGMLSSVPGMSLVDIHALSASCGPACTEDGIHFSNHTYDTAVQVGYSGLSLLVTTLVMATRGSFLPPGSSPLAPIMHRCSSQRIGLRPEGHCSPRWCPSCCAVQVLLNMLRRGWCSSGTVVAGPHGCLGNGQPWQGVCKNQVATAGHGHP